MAINDSSTTCSQLKEMALNFAKERDWLQFHNPKDLALATSIESCELLELFLWSENEVNENNPRSKEKKELIEDEIADIAIFLLEFCNITQINLSKAIEKKIKRNQERYPVEKCFGKADKYNTYVKSNE